MFTKLILTNLLLAQIAFGASIDTPKRGVRGNGMKVRSSNRKLKSKNDELVGDFGKAKGYKKFDGEVTLVFHGKKNKMDVFDIEYEIEDGPENCGEDDDCFFAILDTDSCDDDVEDEDRFYDTKKDPYDDFDFESNENGNAVGVLRDLDVGYEIDDLRGKVIVLIGPSGKSHRRKLKGAKEIVIACAVLES